MANHNRSQIIMITMLVIFTPLFIWLGVTQLLSRVSLSDFSIFKRVVGVVANAIQSPAKNVALAKATEADLKDGFIFTRVTPLPESEWIYVGLANSKTGEAKLIDHSGRWGATPEYKDPGVTMGDTNGLIPALLGPVWGYINKEGAWVIKPQFSGAGQFKNGMAMVTNTGNDGVIHVDYIDTNGTSLGPSVPNLKQLIVLRTKDALITRDAWYKRGSDMPWTKVMTEYTSFVLINDQLIAAAHDGKMKLVDLSGKAVSTELFDRIFSAVNGKAAAQQGGKWGVINTQGKWLVEPQFEGLGINQDGTLISVQQGKIQFLDENGKPFDETRPRPISKTVDGLTAACMGLKCGYVDQNGKWVIQPQFENAFAFSEGVARVIRYGLVAYIDREGRFLTPEPPANAAAPWLWRPDSMQGAQTNNGSVVYGYIDREGKFLIPPAFSHLGNFSENLALARSSNGNFGYIGLNGNWVIPPVFREAGDFSEGLAVVKGSRLLNGIGYIDTQGRVQITLPNDVNAAGNFKDGVAEISNYSGQGMFIDKTGNITKTRIAKTEVAEAGEVKESVELQRLSINGGKLGFADAEDNFVIEPKFDDASDFDGDYAAVKIGDKWGYINRAGKIIIEPAFDEAKPFADGLAQVRNGENWSSIDINGQETVVKNVAVAGDFHDGRARVGINLYTAKKRAAGMSEEANADKFPNFMPGWPVMIAEGSDMSNGVATIKLVSGGYYNNYLYALINKRGELIIPKSPTAQPSESDARSK
jgi:hypothetical protein